MNGDRGEAACLQDRDIDSGEGGTAHENSDHVASVLYSILIMWPNKWLLQLPGKVSPAMLPRCEGGRLGGSGVQRAVGWALKGRLQNWHSEKEQQRKQRKTASPWTQNQAIMAASLRRDRRLRLSSGPTQEARRSSTCCIVVWIPLQGNCWIKKSSQGMVFLGLSVKWTRMVLKTWQKKTCLDMEMQ